MSIFDKLKRKNKDVGYWESKLGVEGGFRQYNGRDMRSDCKIKNVKKNQDRFNNRHKEDC
ncbi:MAG: hypothetical protein E7242_01340 [Lachnospiraceae bacterium]|nr:hypothetical protein [Lachnospiraceae bacterium]